MFKTFIESDLMIVHLLGYNCHTTAGQANYTAHFSNFSYMQHKKLNLNSHARAPAFMIWPWCFPEGFRNTGYKRDTSCLPIFNI